MPTVRNIDISHEPPKQAADLAEALEQATTKALEFDGQYPEGEIKVSISRPRLKSGGNGSASGGSLPAMWHIRVKANRDSP